MRLRMAADVLWTVLAAGGTLAGISVCARQQGSMRAPGIRLALIVFAILLGIAGGLIVARLTSRRGRRRKATYSRKSRRHVRAAAFAISGVVIACSAVAFSLPEVNEKKWLILGVGAVGLAVIWGWYVMEGLGLTSGAMGARHRKKSSSDRDRLR